MFLPVRQIECSSISEYSERIIKSNHLDSGKVCSCLCSLHLDVSVSIQQINMGLKMKEESMVAHRFGLRLDGWVALIILF